MNLWLILFYCAKQIDVPRDPLINPFFFLHMHHVCCDEISLAWQTGAILHGPGRLGRGNEVENSPPRIAVVTDDPALVWSFYFSSVSAATAYPIRLQDRCEKRRDGPPK